MDLGVQVESLENRFRHHIEIWDPIYASYIESEICAILYLSTFWKVSVSSSTKGDYFMSKKTECNPPPRVPHCMTGLGLLRPLWVCIYLEKLFCKSYLNRPLRVLASYWKYAKQGIFIVICWCWVGWKQQRKPTIDDTQLIPLRVDCMDLRYYCLEGLE
jgi:hypothetical protein